MESTEWASNRDLALSGRPTRTEPTEIVAIKSNVPEIIKIEFKNYLTTQKVDYNMGEFINFLMLKITQLENKILEIEQKDCD